jgi:hypothetical protein
MENTEEVKPENEVKIPQADIKVIVKQPKVTKTTEKKELSEAQQAQMLKMREARQAKTAERRAIKEANAEDERKQREDAVRKAEEDAKKITLNVEVQKVRGRKVGVPQPRAPVVRNKPVEEQLSQHEMHIRYLQQKGIHVPDNATPYMLKMITSRFR